jgi:hypothetical protein
MELLLLLLPWLLHNHTGDAPGAPDSPPAAAGSGGAYLPIQFRDIDGLLLLAIFSVSISPFGNQQFGQLQPAIT